VRRLGPREHGDRVGDGLTGTRAVGVGHRRAAMASMVLGSTAFTVIPRSRTLASA
jgi:hypothetical protein